MVLFAATMLPSQSAPSPPQGEPKSGGGVQTQSGSAKQSATSSQPARLKLPPVSTSEEAQNAAREISKRRTSGAKPADAQGKSDESLPGTGSSSAVDEFKPGRPADSTDGAVVMKESKKSAGKNIHGTAYGGLDPAARGNHEAGGTVGATSKSGKTSVYVETDTTRATSSSH